jgi:hypothetical protein
MVKNIGGGLKKKELQNVAIKAEGSALKYGYVHGIIICCS